MTWALNISNNGQYIIGVNSANLPVLYNTVTQSYNTIDLSNIQGLITGAGTTLGTNFGPGYYNTFYVNNSGMVVGDTMFEVSGSDWGYDEGWLAMPGQSAVPLSTFMPAAPSGHTYMFTEAGINDQCQIAASGPAWNSAGDQISPQSYLLSPLGGDANLDGKVDINDLTIVLAHAGQTGMSWTSGDFIGDGTVDINDLTIVLAHYGQTTGASSSGVAPVPEPAALLLVASGLLGLLAWAWRKRR